MIQRTIVANLGCLANHNTHPMINKKTTSDSRAGVNFNSSEKTSCLRNQPR
jgi:hypothetical protein